MSTTGHVDPPPVSSLLPDPPPAAVRNRFAELVTHLKGKSSSLGFSNEQCEADIGKLTPGAGGHNETVDGWHFCELRYTGLFYIDTLPESSILLFSLLVKAWLDSNDAELRSQYNLPAPDIETVDLGGGLVNLAMSVEFVDQIYLVEDEDGPIEWMGTKYASGTYPVDVAEDLDNA